MSPIRFSFAILLLLCIPMVAQADWLRFRGPNGTGINEEDKPTPVEWSATKNLKWKVPLPGPGSSSPIVVGDRLFVTCWSGYGLNQQNPGDQEDLKRHLVCIDCKTGDEIWSKAVDAYLPEDRYRGMFAQHGYASHTPVSDGQNVYVYFGKTGALAFDMEGNQLWQTSTGTESGARGWGSASSPILYKNLLIVSATAESEALVALNKENGEEVWRAEAAGFNSTWGTPVLVKVDDDRTDLVIGVPYEIWGFNPENGKLRWYCEAMNTDSYCSSVVACDGVVYGIEGRGGGSIAVRVGGNKNVTDSHVVWSGRDSSRIGTPICYDGRLYFFNSGVTCLDAKSGERIFQERLQRGGGSSGPQRRGGFGGSDYSSPVIADGRIYFVSRSGDMHVLKASTEFEQLAVNRVTDDNEDFSATPAVSDGRLFVRSDKHLYCIALEERE